MELIKRNISTLEWFTLMTSVVSLYLVLVWTAPYYVKPVITLMALMFFTFCLFKSAHMILLVAVLLPPILGRPDEILYYPFQSMDWVTIWLIFFGGIYSLLFLKEVLSERIFLIFLGILVLEIITFPLSHHLGRSITELARYLSVIVVLPVSIALSKKNESRNLIFFMIILSLAIPLIVGYYQAISGDVSPDSIERTATARELEEERGSVYSTFWYNHPFAKYLRIIIPLIFTSILFQKKKEYRLSYLVLFILSFIILALTNARSQFIGSIIAFGVIFYSLGVFKINNILKYGPIILPLFIAMIFVTGLDERFSDLFQPIDLSSNVRENSLKMRFIIWAMGFPGIMDRPIIGHGPDNFGGDIGIVSHNDYLGMWYNLGLFGMILYAMIFIYTYRYLMKYRNLIDFKHWRDKAIYYSTIGLSVALAIESIVENIFDTAIMWRIYLIMIGCSISIINEHKRDQLSTDLTVQQ